MRILLPTDGSPCSDLAVREVIRRPWPPETEVKVLSVADALPFVPEPTLTGIGLHYYSLDVEQKHAAHAASATVDQLVSAAPQLNVTSAVLEGSPSARIVEEAERWGADLIVLGSHGHGAVMRMLLGSVSHRVVLNAPCSVEVVRRLRREHAEGHK